MSRVPQLATEAIFVFKRFILIAGALLAATVMGGASAAARPSAERPTIILVHGAFAESSSWDPVIRRLLRDGFTVVAAANPLRSLKGDAAYVAALARAIEGKVLLVGHSYGGEVISVAAVDAPNVAGLVFVSGVVPDVGESASSLGNRFPGSTLGQMLLPPVPQPDGKEDIYIAPDKYWHQFAADLPRAQAQLMAAGQRPITQEALDEPATSQSWKTLPSWFIYGSQDRNIPASEHAFLAKRAKSRETIEVKGSSHVVMLSHPDEVTQLIERAANSL